MSKTEAPFGLRQRLEAMFCSNDQRHTPLTVTRSSLPPLAEYVAEIAPLWESHWLTNMGQKHEELRQALEDLLEVDDCVLFANGHSALQATLEAMELCGEVITTPFTFSSTTHAIVRAGLTPVMCDVRWEDGTLDPECAETLVTDCTCAILPVHVYGNVCDVEGIGALAKLHNLKVIYDAAHAFGERVGGVSVARFGDASVFSFHATKVFNSVEGGAVCLRGSDGLRRRLELLRNFGIVDEEHVEGVGFNAKMSELHASMGLCNLRHHQENVKQRLHALARYHERLADVRGLRFLSPVDTQTAVEYNGAYCAVAISDGFGVTRDELHESLSKRGVFARKYFYPCTNAYACYAGVLDPNETPVARHLSEQVLCLPLFAPMSYDQVDFVCDAVLQARA